MIIQYVAIQIRQCPMASAVREILIRLMSIPVIRLMRLICRPAFIFPVVAVPDILRVAKAELPLSKVRRLSCYFSVEGIASVINSVVMKIQ